MMNIHTDFIVIDDDEFNNKICVVTLQKLAKDVSVTTFLDPVEGFEFIAAKYADAGAPSAVLFLDINMPVLNGWQFLDRFHALPDVIKNKVKIYILSSSVDKEDMQRAKANMYVVHYLIKPLTQETIRLITRMQNK